MCGYFLGDQRPLLQELVKKPEMGGWRLPSRDALQSFGIESVPRDAVPDGRADDIQQGMLVDRQ
jgi:hypothetical protein